MARVKPELYYTAIKQRILYNYSISPEARLRQLLKDQVLSEGKPYFLLSRLRNLNDDNCTDAVI